MPAFDVVINGDPIQVRGASVEALESRGFRFTWTDEWNGLAEKGSKVGNALAGAFAQYFAIKIEVMSGAGSGQTIVRFTQGNSGLMGGLMGASKVKKNYQAFRDEFSQWFQAQGTLVGVHEHA